VPAPERRRERRRGPWGWEWGGGVSCWEPATDLSSWRDISVLVLTQRSKLRQVHKHSPESTRIAQTLDRALPGNFHESVRFYRAGEYAPRHAIVCPFPASCLLMVACSEVDRVLKLPLPGQPTIRHAAEGVMVLLVWSSVPERQDGSYVERVRGSRGLKQAAGAFGTKRRWP